MRQERMGQTDVQRFAAFTLIALSSFGEPLSGARKYGNSFAKNAEVMYAPSVYLSAPAGAFAETQPPMLSVHRTPIATRSSMSTTSSPGRRPFGNPALSPPRTPRRFCDAPAVGAIDVLRRSISDPTTLGG